MSSQETFESRSWLMLESARKNYLSKRLEQMKKLQEEISIAAFAGFAREAITVYPNIRYVKLDRPINAGGTALMVISEVLDGNHDDIPREPGLNLCWELEHIIFKYGMDLYYPTLKAGEYDLVELANTEF